jgi:hypothetical protein
MTDWSGILAHAFATTARKCGDGGDSGDEPAKALGPIANKPSAPVTPSNRRVVTVVTRRAHDPVTSVTTPTPDGGDKGRKAILSTAQEDRQSVTTVTSVTTDIHSRDGCVVNRLRSMTAPVSFSAETWRQLLLDADSFFQRWAERAELLGWSDKDLIGVHPTAPAVRYEAMGLVLLIRGGNLVEMDERAAVLRSPGGSLLTYRRLANPNAIPLWDLPPGSTEEVG